MFLYLKALHIVFIVTWFAGLFYVVRLFIYNTEANDKPEGEKQVLQAQFRIMTTRLWLGITWPSAVLTALLGPLVMYLGNWHRLLGEEGGGWLLIKLFFVAGLYAYHFTLHRLYRQHAAGIFRYSSQQLRLWNEVATVFLIAIVMLATVKQSLSFVWGLLGLVAFVIVLLLAIRLYKRVRGT